MDLLTDTILSLATSPWVYLIALGLVVLDGVFPVFPSEVVIVGLAAIAASGTMPDPVLLFIVAAVGAMIGDTLTYTLGRLVGVRRLQATRFRPLARMLRWASRRMGRRTGMVILTARFIPFARLAVNLTAGSTGLPIVRFAPFCVLAGIAWAAYNVTMGLAAGRWFAGQPLLGMGLAIVLAVALGLLLDIAANHLRRSRRLP
jgi:membrane-associated protein